MKNKKRILVCPLDWGLGHAARCIPVIRELLNNEADVVIGADSHPLAMLQKEFPELDFVKLKGYEITYPSNGKMALHIAKQAPVILKRVGEEQRQLKQIIAEKQIDAVISDNRYGLWSKSLPCVFITHQILVKSPVFESFIHRLNKRYISKYSQCWIPDFEDGETLSGELSHRFNLPENVRFIGALSRFNSEDQHPADSFTYDVMAVVSGPEPQRSIFEEKILNQLRQSNYRAILVQGLAGNENHSKEGRIEIHSHLPTSEMLKAIRTSKVIISRPGYSTIMDLAVLGKNAIFVPTPGQTEQEYLAAYHAEKGHFLSVNQDDFDLVDAMEKSAEFQGIKLNDNGALLQRHVRDFLSLICENS